MPSNTAENLMLSQALRLLAQVDDLRRLSFDIGTAAQWEPPLDLIETRTEIVAYVALPGVEAADVTVTAQDDMLILCGERQRPPEWREAGLLRVELPWGPFQRRVRIPAGCQLVKRQSFHGYLVIHLKKPASEAQG
ncbi:MULTISPECIES: Hsp20/alpha crystallin family protein [Roseovarius]|uniref:Hsp20/alpha crystallin family protein n=1 Tax=Roseovarius TaxID=74030 RepID=UPI0014748547|nr:MULTISPECIES: Hsp20/alpha crystallin family protein [Roseovarius]